MLADLGIRGAGLYLREDLRARYHNGFGVFPSGCAFAYYMLFRAREFLDWLDAEKRDAGDAESTLTGYNNIWVWPWYRDSDNNFLFYATGLGSHDALKFGARDDGHSLIAAVLSPTTESRHLLCLRRR